MTAVQNKGGNSYVIWWHCFTLQTSKETISDVLCTFGFQVSMSWRYKGGGGIPPPPPPHLLSIITPQRAAHDPRAAISNTKTKIKLKQVKRFLPTLRIELGRCLSNHCLSHLKQYSRKICSSYYNAIYYSVKEIFSCPWTLTTEIFLCWFVFALLVITFALDRRPPKKSSNSRRSGCLDYKLIFVLCVFSFW